MHGCVARKHILVFHLAGVFNRSWNVPIVLLQIHFVFLHGSRQASLTANSFVSICITYARWKIREFGAAFL